MRRVLFIPFLLWGCVSADSTADQPRPFRIVDRPHIPCLVNRGAYCIPDMGYFVTVYSSDEAPITILKIGYRMAFSGYGFILEKGRCESPSRSPALISRSAGFRFEGDVWDVTRYSLNAETDCQIEIL